MKERQPGQGQSQRKNQHRRLDFVLSDGALNLIAPVDGQEVKEFNKAYAGLLELLKI